MAKGKSIALLGPGHNSITELQAFIGSQTIEHWPIDRLKESERKLRRHSRRKINSLTRAFANFKIAIPVSYTHLDVYKRQFHLGLLSR